MAGLTRTLLVFMVSVALWPNPASAQPPQHDPTDAALVISEFVASNNRSLRDSDGDYPDWIEIQNTSADMVDLDGWSLTDNMDNLRKWEFPAVELAPGRFLVVFASGKDRREPQAELHTNFALAAGGESLALVAPDGTLAHAYIDYPPQFADISYGLSVGSVSGQTETVLVPQEAQARAWVPADGSLGTEWMLASFDDSEWLTGTTGVGYDYPSYVGLDVSFTRGVATTVYIRIPFHVADPAQADRLILYMRYEDGFVAFLNGFEVARANAPDGPDVPWNASATAIREDSDAVDFEEFDISAFKNRLVAGDNLLAIHGLNADLVSSDLLALPELTAIHIERIDLEGVAEGYLLQPTPGAANQAAMAQIGPAIRDVTENPPAPADDEDLVITARVYQTQAPVLGMQLAWVVGFDSDSRFMTSDTVTMVDDGTGDDAMAGDGLYTATIPSQSYEPGDMVRWCVSAVDTRGQL